MSLTDYAIKTAKTLLEKGACIAIPTETVYGLAANAYDKNAIKKIFILKERPLNNPLIIHTGSIKKIDRYVTDIPDTIRILADHFSPGPITFLLPKKKSIPDIVTAGSSKVAIRIPNHPLTLRLLNNLEFPLAAPSANKFMQISPTAPIHVRNNFANNTPFILDGGPCKIGIESTIIEYDVVQNRLILHRYGGISPEQIQKVISIPIIPYSGKITQTAGQHTRHYAPNIPLYYETDIYRSIKKLHGKKIALLSFSRSYKHLSEWIKEEIVINESYNNFSDFSKHFYDTLMRWENKNMEAILVTEVPKKGIGFALHDRLIRARTLL